jgi:hypothetical protein
MKREQIIEVLKKYDSNINPEDDALIIDKRHLESIASELQGDEKPYYCIECSINGVPNWWTGNVPHLSQNESDLQLEMWTPDIHKSKKYKVPIDASNDNQRFQINGTITEHLDIELQGEKEPEKEDSVLDYVNKWNFIANQSYPKKDGKYWVMDNKGNIERVVWSNSGYMNEPYCFSHGQIINSVQIVCWTESILPSMPKLQKKIMPHFIVLQDQIVIIEKLM